MTRFASLVFIFIFCLCMDPITVRAQGFGSAGNSSERAGNSEGTWHPAGEAPLLPPENALNFITIDGTADIRVVPEGIRVVLAITSEGETADSCQEKNAAQVQAVLKAWADLKIAKENIVEDFISVLPVYEWRQTQRDGEQFRVQQRQGYRMQTNLHVSVNTEADAMAAINRAFKQGVTDIVTFDYWSSQLDAQKVKARAAAIEAAKAKVQDIAGGFRRAAQSYQHSREHRRVLAPFTLPHVRKCLGRTDPIPQ